MDNKTLAIVSYITLIGWVVAFFIGKEKADNLLKYHLKQSLGILIISFALGIIIQVIARIVPTIAGIISFVLYIILLVLMIKGIINAAGEKQKPLPIIGAWADKAFTFIK